MALETIVIPKSIAKRLREEAEKAGLSIDEYLLELITQNLDPKSRAKEYVKTAEELIEQAREELRRGNVRQAAEKLWGAAALSIKAYAYWRENRRLSSHRELWEYKRRVAKEIGNWVFDSWASANEMHICFYEGWCECVDVEEASKRIERLVREIASRIKETK